MKLREYINCTQCGSFAVTSNKRTCNSIRSGKVCGGKIIKVKGLLILKTNGFIDKKGRFHNPIYLGLWRCKNKTT